MKSNNTAPIFLIATVFLVFLHGCRKEIKTEPGMQSRFLRMYPENGDQRLYYAHPTKDNGAILIYTNKLDISGIFDVFSIAKTDEFGNIQWKKTLTDSINKPQITPLSDGSLLIGSGDVFGYIMKLNPEGEVSFNNKYFDGWGFLISNPIRGDNGNYFIGLTNRGGTNVIESFDPSGNELKFFIISGDEFGGHVNSFRVYKQSDPDIFYVYGTMRPFGTGYSTNPRIFVSRIRIENDMVVENNTKILDPDNNIFRSQFTEGFFRHIMTEDHSLVLTEFQRDFSDIDVAYVAKVDLNLNKLWDIRIRIGNRGTQPKDISICKDGNYLLSGWCIVEGLAFHQPFACKISPSGQIIWKKIFEMPLESIIYSGRELSNGDLLFGGSTNSFGAAKDLSDLFILKTDQEGNLK